MSRLIRLMVSSLPLIGAVLIGYFLYRSVPSSAMLIVLLLIIFVGVLISFLLYNKLYSSQQKEEIIIDETFYPELSDYLIYITAKDFSTKSEIKKGRLWIAGYLEGIDVEVKHIDYQPLTDETIIEFKKGYTIKLTQVPTFAYDDDQFHVIGFKNLTLYKHNKVNLEMNWTESGLFQKKEGKSEYVNVSSGLPVIVFINKL